MEFEHMTADLTDRFKVKGAKLTKVKVTASRNAGENLLNHQ